MTDWKWQWGRQRGPGRPRMGDRLCAVRRPACTGSGCVPYCTPFYDDELLFMLRVIHLADCAMPGRYGVPDGAGRFA